MKKILLVLLASGLLLTACKKEAEQQANDNQTTQAPVAEEQPIKDDGHTAENSLDWEGIYQGTIPAANYGIELKLTLKDGNTYVLESNTIRGKKKSDSKKVEGNFTWDKDNAGIIHLEGSDEYKNIFISESYAEIYGDDGKPVDGDDHKYKLDKIIEEEGND